LAAVRELNGGRNSSPQVRTRSAKGLSGMGETSHCTSNIAPSGAFAQITKAASRILQPPMTTRPTGGVLQLS
jgi:hypothetical protein